MVCTTRFKGLQMTKRKLQRREARRWSGPVAPDPIVVVQTKVYKMRMGLCCHPSAGFARGPETVLRIHVANDEEVSQVLLIGGARSISTCFILLGGFKFRQGFTVYSEAS